MLLLFGAQAAPFVHVVGVFLDEGIAAACEFRVFSADQCVFGGDFRLGVFRTIDKANDGAAIKIAKALHRIDGMGRVFQLQIDEVGHFVTQRRFVGADVKKHITRRGHGGVFRAFDGLKRAQFFGLGRVWKQHVPSLCAKAYGGVEMAARKAVNQAAG